MKIPEIEAMSRLERRRFLKTLGVFLGAAAAGPSLRYACNELAGGAAFAQTAGAADQTYFIEIGLRDQWDQAHVMVAPGLATNGNLRRGINGNMAALYYGGGELRQRTVNGTQVFLTDDSAELEPHLNDIALIDSNELCDGPIHGHEGTNPLRSPGRAHEQTAGKLAVFSNDPTSNFPGGNDAHYSSTPTPATLHNYRQKQLDGALKNGFAFKGIARDIHTVYHFGAGLPGAELDRMQSKGQLFNAFPARVEDFNVVSKPEHASVIQRILKRVDGRYLAARKLSDAAKEGHTAALEEAKGRLYVQAPRVISLPITAAEEAYWRSGVPDQVAGGPVRAQPWEQAAYASKILSNDLARSIALEFEFVDQHGGRPEAMVRTMAQQASRPLARLITSLKAAGIWDRTLIAMYTVDGSRAVDADSYGNRGKNTLILAGGMIRGGYWGDIRVAGNSGSGHDYSYHGPDLTTGMPTASESRLPSNRVWRTVMKALKVPDALCAQFPDVAGASALPFLLKG